MKNSLLSLFVALLAWSAPALSAERIVTILNWSDYIDPGVLEDFTRETGVKIIYDAYDSNESLEKRLLSNDAAYDLVTPSAAFLQRHIKAGVLQPIDQSRLSNAANIWPQIANRLSQYDPGNRYAINYMWYTTGVAYNVAKIKQRLGDKPISSWEQVLRPENLKKFADCGVYVIDSPEDVFSITLNFLKLDPGSRNPADIRRAADHLFGLKRFIKKFHSSEYINALANGDICLAIGWTGDSLQARNRARDAGNNVDIAYVIPAEGTLLSLDVLTIPKNAPHLAEAYLFIDYMLRPDVAARNTRLTNFANGVLPSRPLVDKDISDNPSVYPSEAMMKRLFTVAAPEPSQQKFIAAEWARAKGGR